MTRPPDDNTPPDAPHAPGTDADPHRGEVSEARPDLLRRLLDILGWESGTEEQALEALADAVRVARGGRMGKDVHLQRNEARAECERLVRRDGELTAALERRGEENAELRRQLDSCHERAADLAGHYRQLVQERNEARAECERLRRELSAAREAVGEGWLDEDRTLAEAIRRKVHVLECERENLLADEHPPVPVDGPRSEHQHTGATAFWCGICGDCVCPRDSNGECHFDNEKCPLHRAGSAHVEGPEGGAR